MSELVIFTSAGTIFLAAVTHATLQMELSTMLLLYHASLGRHVKKKTKQLANNFILGSALLIALLLCSCCYFIALLSRGGTLPLRWLAAMTGIMLALAFSIFFFYYKSGRTTELWLPKIITRYINSRAKKTESNVESFGLGMLAVLSETPFSLVLIIAAANSILALPEVWQVMSITGYTLIAVLPAFMLKTSIRHGRTVVDAQKWRMKNKNFFRTVTAGCFLTLAIFMLAFRIMG